MRKARLTTGEEYVSTSPYKNLGALRYCHMCKEHKPHKGGHMRVFRSGKGWVCQLHPKAMP